MGMAYTRGLKSPAGRAKRAKSKKAWEAKMGMTGKKGISAERPLTKEELAERRRRATISG